MARFARAGALSLVIAAVAALSARTVAQSLQRLTVTQLTLSADTTSPHIEQPFHLIIIARVRERIKELDNVNLPILAELELLGDEHTLVSSAHGTTYREMITVVAHHSGTITIAPVTLDAIDPRDNRAKRYFSNSLTLQVGGAVLAPPSMSGVWDAIRAFLRAIATLALIVIGLTGIGVLLAAFLRRRPAPPVRAPDPPPEPAAAVNDPKTMISQALSVLRAEPTRAGAMRARAIVRRMFGASETETLQDVLRRPNVSDHAARGLLRALERAGFTYERDLSAAIAAAIAEMERMTR
jgi:hypothetical protein